MLDTDGLELDTIQEQENIVIDTANDILLYRLSTTPNNHIYKKYREDQENKIERINELYPQIEGIMFESVFYLACKKCLSWEINISTGLQDIEGVDFILGPKNASIPIDVTLDEKKYPNKVKDHNKYTLLIPNIKEYFHNLIYERDINYKSFLEDIYKTNYELLMNNNQSFQINGDLAENPTKKLVTLSERRHEDMLAILFIFVKP